MSATPTLRKLNDALRSVHPPLIEGLEQRRLLAVDIQFSGPADVDEGSEAGYAFAFSGLPQGATFGGWQIDWGDGSSSQICASGGGAVHVYPDGDGDFTINVYAYDEDGSYSAGPFDAFCGNVAPSLGIATNSGPFSEGSQVTLATSVWDPGDDTIQGWIIDWGDGSGSQTYYADETMTHLYDDADGTGSTYHVSAQAWDEDGTYSAAGSAEVGVGNVVPSISLSGTPSTINEGEAFTLSRSYFDPGDDSIYEWHIDWGDGCSENLGDAESFVHTYANGGREFSVSAVAYDDDGTYAFADADNVLVRASVRLVANTSSLTEGGGSATYTISRATAPGWPLAVSLNAPGGSASEGSDFPSTPRTVEIPAGAMSYTLVVAVTDDQQVEPDETLTLALASGSLYTFESQYGSASTTILDNDVNIVIGTQIFTVGETDTISVSTTDYYGRPKAITLTVGSYSQSIIAPQASITTGADGLAELAIEGLAAGTTTFLLAAANGNQAQGNAPVEHHTITRITGDNPTVLYVGQTGEFKVVVRKANGAVVADPQLEDNPSNTSEVAITSIGIGNQPTITLQGVAATKDGQGNPISVPVGVRLVNDPEVTTALLVMVKSVRITYVVPDVILSVTGANQLPQSTTVEVTVTDADNPNVPLSGVELLLLLSRNNANVDIAWPNGSSTDAQGKASFVVTAREGHPLNGSVDIDISAGDIHTDPDPTIVIRP